MMLGKLHTLKTLVCFNIHKLALALTTLAGQRRSFWGIS